MHDFTCCAKMSNSSLAACPQTRLMEAACEWPLKQRVQGLLALGPVNHHCHLCSIHPFNRPMRSLQHAI